MDPLNAVSRATQNLEKCAMLEHVREIIVTHPREIMIAIAIIIAILLIFGEGLYAGVIEPNIRLLTE